MGFWVYILDYYRPNSGVVAAVQGYTGTIRSEGHYTIVEPLPADNQQVKKATYVYEIVGGNHAYFGNYGEQKGDGTALITPLQQQREAVELILKFTRGQL